MEQSEGWVEVEWDNGLKYSYRIGAENSHDIKLAGNYVCVYVATLLYICTYVYYICDPICKNPT